MGHFSHLYKVLSFVWECPWAPAYLHYSSVDVTGDCDGTLALRAHVSDLSSLEVHFSYLGVPPLSYYVGLLTYDDMASTSSC